MKIDHARAQKAFADYAAHYNADDPKVKLKIDHTYRVAALCDCIAKSLTLPPEERDPLGPMPGDPAWAGGSGTTNGGVGAVMAGARSVVSGLAGRMLPGRG